MKHVISENLHGGIEKSHVKIAGLLVRVCTREFPHSIEPVCNPLDSDANTHVTRPRARILYIYVEWWCYFAFWDMSNTHPLDQGNLSNYNVLNHVVPSKSETCSKVKAQLSLCTRLSWKGRGWINSLTVNLDNRRRWAISLTRQSLHPLHPPGTSLRYALNRCLSWPQSWSARSEGNKKIP